MKDAKGLKGLKGAKGAKGAKGLKGAKRLFARLLRDEQGTEVVEWALVAGFIIIAAIAAISAVGGNVGEAWDSISTSFEDLPPG